MSVTQAPDGDDRHAVLAPVGTTNSLTDATTYTPVGEEDMKGAFFSEGQLAFEGEVALRLTGLYKHALCSDDYIEICGGQITVESSVSDALHCKDYFEMTGEGGATSTPSSQSAQCSAVYSGSNASTGTTYSVTDSAGNHVLSVTVPRSYSSMTMLFSAPELLQSGTYAIKTGCTLSGGTDFQGLVTGGTASGGSQLKSFTTSSKVTTVR